MAAKLNYFKESGLPHVRFRFCRKRTEPASPCSEICIQCRTFRPKRVFCLPPETSGCPESGTWVIPVFETRRNVTCSLLADPLTNSGFPYLFIFLPSLNLQTSDMETPRPVTSGPAEFPRSSQGQLSLPSFLYGNPWFLVTPSFFRLSPFSVPTHHTAERRQPIQGRDASPPPPSGP